MRFARGGVEEVEVDVDGGGPNMAIVLDAIPASRTALRIDGENPPEQSVPSPTYRLLLDKSGLRKKTEIWLTLIPRSSISPTLATPLLR